MLEPELPAGSRPPVLDMPPADHGPPNSPDENRGPATPAPAAAPRPDEPEPAPAPAAELTPAELAPPPRLWERLAWYAGTVLLSCVLVFWGLRLDRADLRAPFSYDLDSLLILPMVKATTERGLFGHWRNERLGAPLVQELHDYPVIDHLHFALIWLLGKFVSNLMLLYNLYFLLTFPLTALAGMLVFRYLGLSLPAAAVGGLLYTFLPYHYQRWENHYFLAAYWLVPLSMLPAFALLRGELPFFRRGADGTFRRHLRTRAAAGQVALAAATASAGAYYAFFACAVIAFAGLYAWVTLRAWRALASAAAAAGLVVGFGLVNHLPTVIYQARYDVNPVTDRGPEEADVYGMKIAHLLLPAEDHNLTVFRKIKAVYNSPNRPLEFENRSASLGLIGSAGLIGLGASLLLPFRRPGWPYAPLAALTLFLVLLATIGGVGTIFNLFVTASIRGYNRASVFIAFLCLAAVLWAVDGFLLTRSVRYRRFRYPAWAALLLVGFLDQTPYSWFRSAGVAKTIEEQAQRFHADARFFEQVEQMMPGGKVFCLPYVPYPEVPTLHRMPVYEHARGYVHTGTLSWSFGAMKGREADAWQADVGIPIRNEAEVREMLLRVVARGFDGLFIDGRGFPPPREPGQPRVTAAQVINDIDQAYAAELGRPGARLPEIIHEGREQFLLDLRPYRDVYARKYPAAFEAIAARERDWVAVLWLGGFMSGEVFGSPRNAEYHEGPPDGRVWFVNPSDHDQTLVVSATFGVHGPGPFRLRLSGLVADEFELDKRPGDWEVKNYGLRREYRVTVPPGRHAVRIECTPPPGYIHTNHRKLCYYVKDFRVVPQ